MTTRRAFLQGSATASALLLGFRLPAAPSAEAIEAPDFRPNAWLRVGRDGRARLTVGKSEMGQGVRTTLPMILAEELELPWSQVDLEQAMPGPDFKGLSTGGSTSTTTLWMPLRKAAAAAREMLVAAAAARWKVEPSTCTANLGFVHHPPSKQRLAYGALVAEAARLAVPQEPKLKDPAAFRLVGQPRKRFDGRAIVTGAAQYSLDLKIPGMKVAVIQRCPVAGGRAKGWNESAVKALPGIHAVVAVPTGIAVVADTAHHALKARQALKVDWDLGPNAGFSSEGLRKSLEGLLANPGEASRTEGDVDAALAKAAKRLSADYEFPFQGHATLEPPNALADVRTEGCEVWVGSQNPNQIQDRAAKLLGLKPEQVKVHVTLIGGGFGRRLYWDFPLEAVEVSRAAKCPVKLIWTRGDDLAHDCFHPMSLMRLEGGLDAEGKVLGWRHRTAAPSILLSWMEGRRSPAIPANETNGAVDAPYFPPACRVEYREAPLHLNLGWWRSIQAVPNTFARECFLDELAQLAGKDPLKLRLELIGEARKVPMGRDQIDTGRLRRVLELLAEKSGWGKPLPKGRGRGLACTVFHGQSYSAQVAEVSVDAKGRMKVEKVTAVLDIGRVVNPLNAPAQVESGIAWALSALRTAITFKEGRVQQTGYPDFPVLTLERMPKVESFFIEGAEAPAGLGEPPVLPLIPAVLNAYAAATGTRLRRLPLALEVLS